MPIPLLYLLPLRLTWIFSQLLCLLTGAWTEHRYGIRQVPVPASPTYPFWAFYLTLSFFLSLTYWPEPSLLGPIWYQRMWVPILILLALRTAAVLESLHHQLSTFRPWSRLMAAAFLTGLLVVFMVWEWPAGRNWEVTLRLKLFLQVWTLLVLLVAWGIMIRVGWVNLRLPEDRHSLLLSVWMTWHGVVSVLSLARTQIGWTDNTFAGIKTADTVIETLVFLTWATWVRRGAQKSVRRGRGEAEVGRSRRTVWGRGLSTSGRAGSLTRILDQLSD